MPSRRMLAFGVALGFAVSPAAWAAHGKAGLWEVTISTTMSGMANLPPQVRAQMQARRITHRFCMTPAEVANDKAELMHNGTCHSKNVKVTGHTFSADVVCRGRMNGTGHIEITYLSPEHYTGRETMAMAMGGTPMRSSMTMEGRWLSADCGTVKPLH